MQTRTIRNVICLLLVLSLPASLTKAEEAKPPIGSQKPAKEYMITREPPVKGEQEKPPFNPKTTKPTYSTEKPGHPETFQKENETTKETEKTKPFNIPAGYAYTFIKDPNTFMKKENPLTISMSKAMAEVIPQALEKSQATEFKLLIDAASKAPVIENQAKTIPINLTQLTTVKNLAENGNDITFLRQINLILEQREADLITYGTKKVGNEVWSDVNIYSKKQYIRDLYFPGTFKRDMDKYLGTCLLITGAKDRIEKGDVSTAKLFYKKAADMSNNNPWVLSEAAKALLQTK